MLRVRNTIFALCKIRQIRFLPGGSGSQYIFSISTIHKFGTDKLIYIFEISLIYLIKIH